jgi:hypothetical protein
MFDLRSVYRRILGQLKVPAIEEILPNPMGASESNPALENVSMTMGRPAAAYPDQDHIAHIKVHLEYAENPAYGGNPVIGPAFAPHALDHIKQHLTLHYLQSMRAYVAQASGGKDVLNLHQENPLDLEAQQALALASQMVDQDSKETMMPYVQQIQALAQKVQQAQQQQQQSAMMSDPTAAVIMQTQMAETKRKQEEAQSQMQLDTQKQQQEYQIKIAELQQKVQDLQIKYSTQTNIDNQRNATDIAMANINNAAKERVAMITAGAQMDQIQAQLEAEQDMSAMEAINAANQDIRQHGLAVQQQAFEQQAQQVQNQIEAQKSQQDLVAQDQAHQQQLAQNAQMHQQSMQQSDQQHQQQMAQMQAQQAAQPPSGDQNG